MTTYAVSMELMYFSMSLDSSSFLTESHSSEMTSAGCEPCLRTSIKKRARTVGEDHEREVCQEEIDVVHIADLINEEWQTLSEQFGVPVHNDVMVDTMLPARQERFAVITPSRKPSSQISLS